MRKVIKYKEKYRRLQEVFEAAMEQHSTLLKKYEALVEEVYDLKARCAELTSENNTLSKCVDKKTTNAMAMLDKHINAGTKQAKQ